MGKDNSRGEDSASTDKPLQNGVSQPLNRNIIYMGANFDVDALKGSKAEHRALTGG